MSGTPDVPEGFEGVVTATQFLRRWNELQQALPRMEGQEPTTAHMDTDFANLFWKVAYRDGYEWGMKDTASAIALRHDEMSSELQVLRDNARDVAASERNLHEATTALTEQRQQIMGMTKDRERLLAEFEVADMKMRRLMRRSPILNLLEITDRTTAAIRRKLF